MPKRELTEEEVALRIGLGAAIRVASGKKKLKPGDLAAAAGVALSQQYRIENGEVTADFLYLVKITRLLGMSLDELLHAALDEVPPALPAKAPVDATAQAGFSLHQSGGGNVQIGQQAGAIHNAGAIGFFKQQKGDKPNARKRSGKG
ncbi:helix-turn-helix domain-containing protein [Vandammella animalimorsus]|uniref:helix-turn-helix domain-containing protein n=1 Tax=Vandammella animalimorsus TaxID=2029117 RepID=UPI00118156D2|nr:helix-turn-helix transcriptional regulator [Vandammella animalimorsus]